MVDIMAVPAELIHLPCQDNIPVNYLLTEILGRTRNILAHEQAQKSGTSGANLVVGNDAVMIVAVRRTLIDIGQLIAGSRRIEGFDDLVSSR